jgi:NADH-quinone oxidoreductase subunit A
LTTPRAKPYSQFLSIPGGSGHYNIESDLPGNEMNQNYLSSYAPILIYFLLAAGVAGAIMLLSWLIGPRKPTPTKLSPYECGVLPTGDAREPFSVKFYLVAILFILFDVEAMFLIVWAVVLRQLGMYGFIIMSIFLFLLMVGFVYEWKKGVLDWAPRQSRRG